MRISLNFVHGPISKKPANLLENPVISTVFPEDPFDFSKNRTWSGWKILDFCDLLAKKGVVERDGVKSRMSDASF